MAEPSPGGRPRPGESELRQVAIVAVIVVGGVLGVAALATFVPAVGDLFDRLPIAIAVLIGGTAWVLWRITRRPGAT